MLPKITRKGDMTITDFKFPGLRKKKMHIKATGSTDATIWDRNTKNNFALFFIMHFPLMKITFTKTAMYISVNIDNFYNITVIFECIFPINYCQIPGNIFPVHVTFSFTQ